MIKFQSMRAYAGLGGGGGGVRKFLGRGNDKKFIFHLSFYGARKFISDEIEK